MLTFSSNAYTFPPAQYESVERRNKGCVRVLKTVKKVRRSARIKKEEKSSQFCQQFVLSELPLGNYSWRFSVCARSRSLLYPTLVSKVIYEYELCVSVDFGQSERFI